jgi:hypothetical protein
VEAFWISCAVRVLYLTAADFLKSGISNAGYYTAHTVNVTDHNSGYYPSSCPLFKTRRFRDWSFWKQTSSVYWTHLRSFHLKTETMSRILAVKSMRMLIQNHCGWSISPQLVFHKYITFTEWACLVHRFIASDVMFPVLFCDIRSKTCHYQALCEALSRSLQ